MTPLNSGLAILVVLVFTLFMGNIPSIKKSKKSDSNHSVVVGIIAFLLIIDIIVSIFYYIHI